MLLCVVSAGVYVTKKLSSAAATATTTMTAATILLCALAAAAACCDYLAMIRLQSATVHYRVSVYLIKQSSLEDHASNNVWVHVRGWATVFKVTTALLLDLT
jgi:hypothetical protein